MEQFAKELIYKFGTGNESVTDLAEALNLLRIYGENCNPCIHRSIREQAYKEFQNIELKRS